MTASTSLAKVDLAGKDNIFDCPQLRCCCRAYERLEVLLLGTSLQNRNPKEVKVIPEISKPRIFFALILQ